MTESIESICPVCTKPSRCYVLGGGRWYHHQGCACIEIRIHQRLIFWPHSQKIHSLTCEAREGFSLHARNLPAHQYLTVVPGVAPVGDDAPQVIVRVTRRKREDPAHPVDTENHEEGKSGDVDFWNDEIQ